jgi:ABC-type nitrate/sulfonate/bicarbonate transport system permease component
VSVADHAALGKSRDSAALTLRRYLLMPRVLSAGGIVCCLLLWEVAGRFTNQIVLAPPSAVLLVLPSMLADGKLLSMYLQTMTLLATSFAASVVLGVGFGLLTGFVPRLGQATGPLLVMLYATPSIVLIPLFVLWFGIGDLPKVTLVFLATFFPVVTNTQLGIGEIGQEMRELGRVFGATMREQTVKIILPAIIPHVLAAVRVSLPRAFFVLLAGEMLISVGGLGSMILDFGRSFQSDRYFLTVTLVILTNLALNWGARKLEQWLMPWRGAAASGSG